MSSVMVGDWVQALVIQEEEGFRGADVWVHAEPGAVGHVMRVDGETITVTFERTETTTDCHVSDLKRLGGADTGRTGAERHRTSGN